MTAPYLHAAGKLPPGVFGFAKDQHLFFYNRLFLAALKQSIDGRVAPDNLPLAGSFVIAALARQTGVKLTCGFADAGRRVDLSPRTGDVSMTFAQKAHLDGVVIGSTPKGGALLCADEGSNMFRQLGTAILGMVEI